MVAEAQSRAPRSRSKVDLFLLFPPAYKPASALEDMNAFMLSPGQLVVADNAEVHYVRRGRCVGVTGLGASYTQFVVTLLHCAHTVGINLRDPSGIEFKVNVACLARVEMNT